MNTAQRVNVWLAGLVLGLVGLGGERSPAQGPTTQRAASGPLLIRGVEVERIDEALGSRELVGREAEDRSFRHLTPVLARGEVAPATVDPEQLYRRRLALYDDESRLIDEDLPRGEPESADAAQPEASPAPVAPRPGRLWRWLAFSCFGTILLAGVVIAVRGQWPPAGSGAGR